MESKRYLNALCRKRMLATPDCYVVKNEIEALLKIDGNDSMSIRIKERAQEERETEKILGVLQNQKNVELVKRFREQQLIDNEEDLRDLRRQIKKAKIAQELVSQLRHEEEIIARRTVEAEQETLAIRAELRAWEEKEKQLENQRRLRQILNADELRAQMQEKQIRTTRAAERNAVESLVMHNKIEENLQKERQEYETAQAVKQRRHQEILEDIQQKRFFLQQQQMEDTANYMAWAKLQSVRFERVEQEKNEFKRKLERRQAISAKIGEENLKQHRAKEESTAHLIELFIIEQNKKFDLVYKTAEEKANDQRRMYFDLYKRHMAQKEAQKVNELHEKLVLAVDRKPIPFEEQEHRELRNIDKAQHYLTNKLLREQAQHNREKRNEIAREKQQIHELIVKDQMEHENKVELAKFKILDEQPVEVLRYLSPQFLKSSCIPEPIAQKIEQQIRKDPFPLLTIKRHYLPELRGTLTEKSDSRKFCQKNCAQSHRISNVF